MPDTWTLIGWGARDWGQVLEACEDMTGAWADYEGFHTGPLPPAQPPTSHIWAWSADGTCLMRARSDADQVVVGWLTRQATDKVTALAQLTEQVAVTIRPATSWSTEDRRVTMRGDARRDLKWETLEVESPEPVTFVWAQERA